MTAPADSARSVPSPAHGARANPPRSGKLSALVLGAWIGASVAMLGVVGYSFPGIARGIEANPRLAERVGFDPGADAPKKTSVPWVVVGELNRAYFFGWNRAQLVLAALALTAAAIDRRRAVAILAGIAAAIVLALTFHYAPEITERGRALDFVPRDPPPPALAEFESIHRLYTMLEVGKVSCLILAAALAFGRGSRSVA